MTQLKKKACIMLLCLLTFHLAIAQIPTRKILPPLLSRANSFGQDLLYADNTLFVSTDDWYTEDVLLDKNLYGTETQNLELGGAILVYRKENNEWKMQQLLQPDNFFIRYQENIFANRFSYKNNVLVVCSERDVYKPTNFARAGAIYVYKRASESSPFERIGKFYSPTPSTTDFSRNGVATDGRYIVSYEFNLRRLLLHEIVNNTIVYRGFRDFSTESSPWWEVRGITDGGVVVLDNNSSTVKLFKIENNGFRALNVTGITPTSGSLGNAIVDRNTIVYGISFPNYNGTTYGLKIVKLNGEAIGENYVVSFPYSATVNGLVKDISVREGQEIVVSFVNSNSPITQNKVFYLKYQNNKYEVLDGIQLSSQYSGVAIEYGNAVACDGSSIIIGDKFDRTKQNSIYTEVDGRRNCSGAFYTYSFKTTEWFNQSIGYNGIAGTHAGEYLGSKTHVQGDNAFAVSRYDNDVSPLAGGIHQFKYLNGGWRFVRKLYSSAGTSSIEFGASIASNSNWLMVGSPHQAIGNSVVGMVSAYSLNGENGVLPQFSITCPNNVAGQVFGKSISMDEEYMAVGAPGDDAGAADAGAVYIYKRVNASWSYVQKVLAYQPQANGGFGTTVALQGTSLAVGAPTTTTSDGTNAGMIYFYELVNGQFVYRTRFDPLNSGANQYLGRSLSISGNYVVAGVPVFNNLGYVQVFQKDASGSWTRHTNIAGSASQGYFGHSVDIKGNVVVATAPNEGNGVINVYQLGNPGSVLLVNKFILDEKSLEQPISMNTSGHIVVGMPYANGYEGEVKFYWHPMQAAMRQTESIAALGGDEATQHQAVSIAPNPYEDGNLYLQGSNIELVEIYALSGQKLGQYKPENGFIRPEGLSQGIYMLNVSGEFGSQKLKLVVNK